MGFVGKWPFKNERRKIFEVRQDRIRNFVVQLPENHELLVPTLIHLTSPHPVLSSGLYKGVLAAAFAFLDGR